MPITFEEYGAERIDLAVPIHKLLGDRPDLAFSSEDIMDMLIHSQMRNASYEEVVMALERLVAGGRAAAKEIEGGRWYTIAQAVTRRRIGFRQEV